MSRLVLALALGAVLAAPGRALAQDVRVTSTTSAAWYGDNGDRNPFDDRYGFGRERLDVSGGAGAWSAALRLDAVGFVDEPTAADPASPPPQLRSRYQDDLELERISLGWVGQDVELWAGDSYVALGRGLGLSLRKLDGLGIDTSLRGGKLLVHTGSLEASLAAGYVNIVNLDDTSGRHADDPYDLAGGGHVVAHLGRVGVGGHAEMIAFHDPLGLVAPGSAPARYQDRWLLYGPILDAPRLGEHLGLYLEGVGQEREGERGFGAYGTLTWMADPVTVLVEAKAYGDLARVQPRWQLEEQEFKAVQYTAVPTVERLLEPLEHDQRDVYGGRVRTDVRVAAAWTTFVSYGLFRDHVGYLTDLGGTQGIATVPGTIHDPYAGFETRWDDEQSHATVSSGWRVVVADGSGEAVRGNLHAELDVVQSLGGQLSLQLHGNHLERSKRMPDLDWREGSLQLGLHLPWRTTVGAGWDYTTEPLEPHRHFFSGTLDVQAGERATVQLFAGAQRGGLKCVSGVCRVFPPFEGVRVQLTLRY
jgi:hypothetical protein